MQAEVQHKKDKAYVSISTFRYNPKTQNMEEMREYILKHLEIGQEYFRLKRARAVGQEMGALADILKSSKRSIPEFSLL